MRDELAHRAGICKYWACCPRAHSGTFSVISIKFSVGKEIRRISCSLFPYPNLRFLTSSASAFIPSYLLTAARSPLRVTPNRRSHARAARHAEAWSSSTFRPPGTAAQTASGCKTRSMPTADFIHPKRRGFGWLKQNLGTCPEAYSQPEAVCAAVLAALEKCLLDRASACRAARAWERRFGVTRRWRPPPLSAGKKE